MPPPYGQRRRFRKSHVEKGTCETVFRQVPVGYKAEGGLPHRRWRRERVGFPEAIEIIFGGSKPPPYRLVWAIIMLVGRCLGAAVCFCGSSRAPTPTAWCGL